MPHQQAVPGAGRVPVKARVGVFEPVVGGVVDAAEGQRGPQVVALGGVVVHHVEDDLDPGLVQRPDHGFELRDLLAPGAAGGVGVVRGEEADGVVAPVVAQPAPGQDTFRHELVDRHQLDRRDSQSLQVLDDRRMRQPLVGAALLLRDERMQLGQAPDMRLIDHGLVVVRPRRPVDTPVEVRIHHHRPRHVRRRIRVVPLVRVPQTVGKHCGGPSGRCPRSPSHTDPAAAWPGCSDARRPGHRGRAPGTRTAGPVRRPAGNNAR